MTLAQAAAFFGFSGTNPAETYRRYEAGLVWPRAEVMDLIISMTAGEVSADGMLAARMVRAPRSANEPSSADSTSDAPRLSPVVIEEAA